MDTQETYERTEVIRMRSSQITYTPADPIQNVISASLSKVTCINRWLNMIDGYNNRMAWYSDALGQFRSVIVPQGTYTHQELATLLTTLMTANEPSTWTVTYDDITGKFTLVCSTAAQLTFAINVDTADCMSAALGFPEVDTPLATSHTSYFTSLLVPAYRILESKALSGGRRWGTQTSQRGDDSHIFAARDVGYIVPMTNAARDEIFYYEDIAGFPHGSDNTFSYQGPRQISEIDLNWVHPCDCKEKNFDQIEGPVVVVLTFQCLKRFK